MGKLEFEAARKHMGSPFVLAYDEDHEGTGNACSLLIGRKRVGGNRVPGRIRVTIEWDEEIPDK